MARYIDADALNLDIDLYKGATVLDLALAVIKSVKEAPTADVAPRAEVDELIYKLECLLCHATGGKLSKSTYTLKTMETVVTDYIQESYDEAYAEARAEVAREIFEEIDRIREETTAGNIMRLTFFKRLVELKKKYQIESTEL